jgi:hypothetical protein
MSENRCDIVFSGETAKGISDIGKFIRDLSVLLKGTSVSVETLFSEKEAVIEKAVSRAFAEERCKAFEKIGIICRIVSLEEEMPLPPSVFRNPGIPEPQFGAVSKPAENDIPLPPPVFRTPGIPEPQFGAVSKPAENDIPPPLPVPVKKIEVLATPPPSLPKKQDELTRYSWKPAKPGALEQALKTVSGLPKVIAPFLVQNIGWFISGFLFLTGCVFLVTYTEGFSRSLIISLILSAYTLLLIGGAYKLLLGRPELRTAGSVLITIGMLMIPLSIAASVRLTDMAGIGYVTTAVGMGVVIISLGLFYWTVRLASGIMDRSLQGSHARLFMILTAVQIAAPVVGRVSEWYLPAVLHLFLLVLLGIGLVRFVREWLGTMFSEQRKLGYYAAGTLIYASVVSFIHLTWRYRYPLPSGYACPFLMILAGLLFYADAAFKQLTHRYAFLSRFTFAVYALSILALSLSFPSPAARVITLTLGAGVYGTVFGQYLTLPPLYLLLFCVCGLYHRFILQYVSQEAWFLAGIPGIACLFAAHRYVVKRQAAGALAMIGFRSLLILTVGLAGWSLFRAEPGPVSTATAAMLTVLLYIVLRYTSFQLFRELGGLPLKKEQDNSTYPKASDEYDLRNSSWFYLVPISGAFTLGYCPVFGNLAWAEQFSMSLMLQAILLTEAGLRLYRRISDTNAVRTLVLLNSAILGILIANSLCLLSASTEMLQNTSVYLTLLLSAGIFLRQSMILRLRFLFYAVLISGGAAGVFIKYYYFPYSSTGMTEIIAALCLWGILWRAERIEAIKQKVGIPEPHFSFVTSHFSLSWLYPAGRLSRVEVMRLPLKQFIVLLWCIALWHFLPYLPQCTLTPAWALNSSLMVLTTMVFAAYFRVLQLWTVPLILGLASLLIPLYHHYDLTISGLSVAAALYALVSWMTLRWAANIPLTLRAARLLNVEGGHNGGRNQVEICTYRTASLIIFSALTVAIRHWFDRPDPAILATLFAGIVFLSLTNRYYRRSSQAYIMLTLLTMAAIVIHVHILSVSDAHLLLHDSRTGLLFALISICMGAASWILVRNTENKKSLYDKPLLQTAIILALIGAGQQLPLIFERSVTAMPVLALGTASLGILFVNHRIGSRIICLIGIFSVNLTLLWGYVFLLHEGVSLIFWLSGGIQIFPALLALGFSSLSYAIGVYSRNSLYVSPLWYVAVADYCWILLHIAVLFMTGIFGESAEFNVFLFLISAIALFPLSAPLSQADRWRGAGLLIMLTGFALNVLSISGLLTESGMMIWAYTLWSITNWVLPSFNSRFPKWNICSEIWIYAGLGMIIISQPVFMDKNDTLFQWSYWLSVSVYLFMMLRNSGSPLFRWSATGTLTWAGILWIGKSLFYIDSDIVITGFIVCPLIWTNFLLYMGKLWRKLAVQGLLSEKWGRHDLSIPLQVWSFMISWVCLLLLFAGNLIVLFDIFSDHHELLSLTGSVTTTLSFLHLFILKPRTLNAHSLILSVFVLVLTGFDYYSSLPHLPLLLAVLSGLLLSVTNYMSQRQDSETVSVTVRAMSGWMTVCQWIVIPAMLFVPIASLTESLLTLGILTAIFAVLSHRRQSQALLWTAHVLGLVLLHTWMLIFVPSEKTQGLILWHIWTLIEAQIPRFQLLMPWYSLQMIAVVWIGIGVCRKGLTQPSFIRKHFLDNLSCEFGIAIAEWGLHLITFISRLMSDKPFENMMIQGIAGLVAVSLIIALGVFRLYHFREKKLVYGVLLLVAAAAVYLRLLWIGFMPLTIGDSSALMAFGWALFMLQRFISDKALSGSLLNVVMLLPILSLTVTASFEAISSLPLCAMLLTAGTLYLSIRYTSGSFMALFLGISSLNGAIYLWIPAWANSSNLIQLYAAPAALSVLILLHLHRKELKPGTLNSMRLASLTVLYACATLDFFLQPEMSHFLLVLFLSLTGAGLGIALRIRAFLYGGVIFMVLNVLAQLFFFYSRQTLGKGIVLVLLGTVIMAGMIAFNIKRETILKRIRIFRTDLEQWR